MKYESRVELNLFKVKFTSYQSTPMIDDRTCRKETLDIGTGVKTQDLDFDVEDGNRV